MRIRPVDERAHRVHDYRHLIARWRRVARTAGLTVEAFARAGEYPLYCVRTPDRLSRDGGLYVSTGIHGDEPAGPEALVQWAEATLPAFARVNPALPLLILPCLNPWGLVNNRRSDDRGRDLNRLFDRSNLTPVRELKRLLLGRRFGFGLSLHEDFDAQGIYGYELNEHPPDWGVALLQAASRVIPLDPRRRIDGRVFKGSLMFRRGRFHRIPVHAETVYLHLQGHATHTFTFETPSEFALAERVRAHRLVIEASVKLLRAQSLAAD